MSDTDPTKMHPLDALNEASRAAMRKMARASEERLAAEMLAGTDRAATERRVMPDDIDITAERDRIGSEMTSTRWRDAIPRRYWDARLTDLTVEPHQEIHERWSARPLTLGPRPNLVILGPVGTGKSHAAVAAVRPLMEEGLDVVFIPSVELLNDLRPGGGGPEPYGRADVLVIDDLGGERPTDWTAEQLYMIVNARYNAMLPTVATANGTPPELKEAIGARLYSRLVGDGAVVLGLGGIDRRTTKS